MVRGGPRLVPLTSTRRAANGNDLKRVSPGWPLSMRRGATASWTPRFAGLRAVLATLTALPPSVPVQDPQHQAVGDDELWGRPASDVRMAGINAREAMTQSLSRRIGGVWGGFADKDVCPLPARSGLRSHRSLSH